MSRFKTMLLAVSAFAALALVIPSAVMAAKPHTQRPITGHVFGTLESLSSTNAVVMTRAGDINVVLKPVVAYVSFDQAAALEGIKVGDQVYITGNFADGTLHADRIRYDNQPFVISDLKRFEGDYLGSSAANTVTIQLDRHRNFTFSVDSNTKYFQWGQPISGPPTYQPGEEIVVWAREYSNQTWLAARVNVKPRPKDKK